MGEKEMLLWEKHAGGPLYPHPAALSARCNRESSECSLRGPGAVLSKHSPGINTWTPSKQPSELGTI